MKFPEWHCRCGRIWPDEIVRCYCKGTRRIGFNKFGRPINDISGLVFGWLTALSDFRRGNDGMILQKFRCKCGKEMFVRKANVMNRSSSSCGCYRVYARALRKKQKSLSTQAS